MTFKELQDKVLAWLDEAGDTATTLTLVKAGLVSAHKKRVSQTRWPFMLWDSFETLSIVANQQTYALHPEFFKPDHFFNGTRKEPVTIYNEATRNAAGVDSNSDTGSATKAQFVGRTPVAAQPTSASVIAVASSAVADNGSASVIIRGVTTDGVKKETVVAGSSSSTAFRKILNVTKTGTWQGTLTLTSNSAAVTNLTLFAEETSRSYQQFYLLQIPSEAETIQYRFYRRPSPLEEDNDTPDIPDPFDEILIYDTLLAFASYNSYDGQTVQLWRNNQAELLLALQQAFDSNDAIDAASNYTEYIDR